MRGNGVQRPPMGNYLLDCSVVVKLLVNEGDVATRRIRAFGQIFEGYGFHLTDYTFAEVCGVLKRKLQEGALTRTQYGAALTELASNIDRGIYDLHRAVLNDTVAIEASLLAEQGDVDFLDAFHFQTMREVPGLRTAVLTTADEGLAKLAAAQGLDYWNVAKTSLPTFSPRLPAREDVGRAR